MSAEALALLDRALPAITALAGVGLAQFFQSRRAKDAHERVLELATLADRRAQRDAKLARLRTAFQPVLIAAWGFQTAASKYVFTKGDPKAQSQQILDVAYVGINEARAQVWLEGAMVRDVFDELEGVRKAYEDFKWEVEGLSKGAGGSAEAILKAQAEIKEGVAKIDKLVDDHLRAIEQSI